MVAMTNSCSAPCTRRRIVNLSIMTPGKKGPATPGPHAGGPGARAGQDFGSMFHRYGTALPACTVTMVFLSATKLDCGRKNGTNQAFCTRYWFRALAAASAWEAEPVWMVLMSPATAELVEWKGFHVAVWAMSNWVSCQTVGSSWRMK